MFGLSETLSRVILAVLFVLCIAGALMVHSCTQARQKAAQAQQDSRTASATAQAAKEAVATVVARSDADAEVDEIVSDAAKEIDNAKSPVAARAAAYNALCELQLYARDPACIVRQPDPR